MTDPTTEEDREGEPLTGLPLAPHVVHVLDSLLPRRGLSRRGGKRSPDTLAEAWRPVSRAEFADWLGFEPPSLPSLTEGRGLGEFFVVLPDEPLLPRRAVPPGDDLVLHVLYAPVDLPWDVPGSYARATGRGMVTVSLETGYGAPWPLPARPPWEVRANGGSGDSVVVPVGDALVGVQRHHRSYTRLAWSSPTPSPGFTVTVWAHLPPVAAVSVLVRDWASMQLGRTR